MAKAPTTRKGAKSEQTNKLLTALNVLDFIYKEDGAVYEQYCRVTETAVSASNGKLGISIPVDAGFSANPSTGKLIDALKHTGEQIAYTILPNAHLAVSSGKFSGYVPTIIDDYLPTIKPDRPCAKIGPELLEALIVCSEVIDDRLEQPIFNGVLIDDRCCAGTDRHTIYQFWHGINLPKGLIIPKKTIKVLKAQDAPLTEFGFSTQTATFYHADGCIIQTALLEGTWPDYEKVLSQQSNQQPIPPDFWAGLRAVLPFAADGSVYFGAGTLETHQGTKGAKYEVPGLSAGRCFNGERLKPLEKYAKTIDFYHNNGAIFYGDRMRGIVARRVG